MGTVSNIPSIIDNETLLAQVLRQLFHAEPVSLGLAIAGVILGARIHSLSQYTLKIFLGTTLLNAILAHYLHFNTISSTAFLSGLFTFLLIQKGEGNEKLTALISLFAAIALTPSLNFISIAAGILPSLLGHGILQRQAILNYYFKIIQRGPYRITDKSNAKPIFMDCEIIDFETRKAA